MDTCPGYQNEYRTAEYMSVISKEEKGLQSRHLFTMFPFSGFRDRVNSTGSITSCCAFEANQGLMRFTVCCVHHMLKGISSIYFFFSCNFGTRIWNYL
jgi:hypothetical protein